MTPRSWRACMIVSWTKRLQSLAASPVREWLWLDVAGDGAAEARRLIDDGLSADAAEADLPLLDALASDFAEIYLTFGKRVSPMKDLAD